MQQDNLGGDFKELDSAREAIGTDLFDQMNGSLRKMTQSTTKFLLTVDKWIQTNPELAGGIAKAATAGLIFVGALGAIGLIAWPVVTGVSALVAAAGFLGTAFTVAGGAIAAALGAISLPVIGVVAVVAGAALMIRKYWEPISAFMAGVAEGFSAAMGPISESFGTLKPALDWITDGIKTAINWFKELIAPVKASKEQLESAGNMGKQFGNMLAEGLKIPSHALDQLRSGIDWVLEKLGIIDKQSDGLGDKVPKPEGAALGGAGYETRYAYNPALGGAAGYAPVTTGGSGRASNQNSYHSEYTINMHPGMTKDDALMLMEQNRAREQRNNAAQQRSKMGWED